MKDFPVFTTQWGVASLVLREIAYTKRAYVIVRSSLEPIKLLEECLGFCRAVGAEEVYASGDPCLEAFPFHTAIWEMQASTEAIGETDAALWPADSETIGRWREIYNQNAILVPNAAWMTEGESQRILKEEQPYFIHRDKELLGIGLLNEHVIRWICACVRGAGADVVKALCHASFEEKLVLEVASTNEKAIHLYQKLGFIQTKEISRWYKIL